MQGLEGQIDELQRGVEVAPLECVEGTMNEGTGPSQDAP